MTILDDLNIYAPGLTLLETVTDDDVFQSMAWSPDGRTLALASEYGLAFATIDIESFTLNWHRLGAFLAAPMVDIAWSPDGQQVMCSFFDGWLIRYSLQEKERVWVGTDADARTVSWSPDGKRILTNGSKVKIWDAEDNQILRELGKSDLRPCLSPSGDKVITGKDTISGRSIHPGFFVWSVDTGALVSEVDLSTADDTRWFSMSASALSPNGQLLAIGGRRNTVLLWNIDENRRVRQLAEPQGTVLDLDFSPEGDFLAAVSSDNIFRVWSARNDWKQVVQLPDLKGGWRGLAFHPTEHLLATCGQGGHSVQFWKYNPSAWR